jgi:hypothetical protein
MTPVVGIDPGTKGGVAVLGPSGEPIYLKAFRPEMTEETLIEALRDALKIARAFDLGAPVFIEKVGYIRGDGGQGAFTFGRISGLIAGAVLMSLQRPRYVYPMMWQSKLNCLSGGNKNVTKKRAADLFPKVKMTHAVADALLIAEYGRRMFLEADPTVGL